MTKRAAHAFGLLLVLAACSPFAAGSDDTNATGDGGATSSGATSSGSPDGSASSDASSGGIEEAGQPPIGDALAWEGDEVGTWTISNVSPFIHETTDCCGSCIDPGNCSADDAVHCQDTTKDVAGGSGKFLSAGAAVEGHKQDGFYASRSFEVTPQRSYHVLFRFTKLAAFGNNIVSAPWKVILYDGNQEVNSTSGNMTCSTGTGCESDTTGEQQIGSSSIATPKITIVVKVMADSNCVGGGVTSVEADLDYVRIIRE